MEHVLKMTREGAEKLLREQMEAGQGLITNVESARNFQEAFEQFKLEHNKWEKFVKTALSRIFPEKEKMQEFTECSSVFIITADTDYDLYLEYRGILVKQISHLESCIEQLWNAPRQLEGFAGKLMTG